MPGRSGGHNRLSTQEHILRGSFRADRHAAEPLAPPAPLSPQDRAHTTNGLGATALRVVAGLLDTYEGWDQASLATLRAYGLSCERLEKLQLAPPDDTRALHREVRGNLALLKALNLEHR